MLEQFWPAALYGCLEDIFSDEDYVQLANISRVEPLNMLPYYDAINALLAGSYFEFSGVEQVFQLLKNERYEGYAGRDSNGVFAIILAKSY